MRTLHRGWTFKHKNGSDVKIEYPVYSSLNKPVVGYMVSVAGREKFYFYEAKKLLDMISDKKLIRIF